MIKKVREHLGFITEVLYAALLIGLTSLSVGLLFNGCTSSPTQSSQQPTAIVLREGQSAMLLEDVTALIQIPFPNGDGGAAVLYEGPAKLTRGSFIQKPVKE